MCEAVWLCSGVKSTMTHEETLVVEDDIEQ